MTIRRTHWAHLAVWGAAVLLAVPLLGAVLWGAWRLLFWGVVAGAPHAHYGPAAGLATPSALPPGVDSMLFGGTLVGSGGSVVTLLVVGLLAFAFLLLVGSLLTPRTRDDRTGRVG